MVSLNDHTFLREWCLYNAELDAFMVGVEDVEQTQRDEFRREAQDWLDRAAAL